MSNKKGLPETAPEQQSPLNIILSQREVLGMLEDASDVELAGPLAKGMINVFIATSGSGKSLLAFLVSWNELKMGSLRKFSIWIWTIRIPSIKIDIQIFLCLMVFSTSRNTSSTKSWMNSLVFSL